MAWISVDERLPNNADDVLVYSPDNGSFRAWYDNHIWLCHESQGAIHPTHWQPLPKAPSYTSVPNPQSAYGMTDNLIATESRPYSVWSESVETAKDICEAWESRFGGPYKIFQSNNGFQVKYMGEWGSDVELQNLVAMK